MRNFILLFLSLCCVNALIAQPSFKFAQVTDTHVGGATGATDLRRTVADLNQQPDIDFVIISGDITEFGSDEELSLAKQILDSLQLPWYIIPGNHDSNWSESGANSFRRIFGAETFFFQHKGFQFIGTASGPNMRMSPGQIPRENLVWIDSIFNANPDNTIPLISVNHYPLDSSLNNWYELIDRLLSRNIQFALCGHGHTNKLFNWEGIPGIMSRSNLRANDEVGGYNIITLTEDSVFFQTRRPLLTTDDYWLSIPLETALADFNPKRPDYTHNENSKVKVQWQFQDEGDIGSGMSTDGMLLFAANTIGDVYALNLSTGDKVWNYRTGGKVYSTPAYADRVVVVGCSDHWIYGLDAHSGELKWKVETGNAVLGSAAIYKGNAFIGGSDGIFRCIRVSDGKVLWTFDQVDSFVSTLPTVADDKVIFGSWGNGFYALNIHTGSLEWEWENGHSNRMFSAAACYPVVANNRVFIVAPDRYMTALDLKTGEVIWREKKEGIRVRESMGLSRDQRVVYAKTMDGELIGISIDADSMNLIWNSALKLPYDLTPTAIFSDENLIFVPSHSGLLSAVCAKNGEVMWQYKISNAMINPPVVINNTVILSTMDGKIVSLMY